MNRVESRFLEPSVSRTSRYLEPNLVSIEFASLKLYNFTPDFSNPQFLETPDNSNQFWLPWDKSAVFILEDALSVWTNLGKHSLFVWLFVSSVKTGTRCTIRLEELSSVVRRSCRTTEDSSCTYHI